MLFAAVLFATLAMGEKITVLQIIGGIAVLMGVYLVQSRNNKVKILITTKDTEKETKFRT